MFKPCLFVVNWSSFVDRIHNCILCLWELSGTVINYGSGSGRTELWFRQTFTVPTVPVPQHWKKCITTWKHGRRLFTVEPKNSVPTVHHVESPKWKARKILQLRSGQPKKNDQSSPRCFLPGKYVLDLVAGYKLRFFLGLTRN